MKSTSIHSQSIVLTVNPLLLHNFNHSTSGVEKLAEYTGGRDFSKFGRVNYTLGRRQELLAEVQRLADSLAIGSGDVGYTCEGAAFFHLYHVTR
jgi:hypothetical protein